MYKITNRQTGEEVKLCPEQDVAVQLAKYDKAIHADFESATRELFLNVQNAAGVVSRVESKLLFIHFYWTKNQVTVRMFADIEAQLLKQDISAESRFGIERHLWLTLVGQITEYMNLIGILDNGKLKSYPMPKRKSHPIVDDNAYELEFFSSGIEMEHKDE